MTVQLWALCQSMVPKQKLCLGNEDLIQTHLISTLKSFEFKISCRLLQVIYTEAGVALRRAGTINSSDKNLLRNIFCR